MKTFNFLAPFALGRLAADSEEDSRIWKPDVTEIVEINLVEGVSQTYAIDTSNSGAYWPNQYIRINVNAPEGFKIRQSFNYFQTEGVGLTGVCDNDAALIFDGPDGNNQENFAFLCDNMGADYTFISSQNVMTVDFKSNEQINQQGFEALFEPLSLTESEVLWIRITDGLKLLKSTVFLAHSNRKSHIQKKKAQYLENKFMKLFNWFGDEAKDACNEHAGTGPAGAGYIPFVQVADPCTTVTNFMKSVTSFYDRYVCLDDFNLMDTNPETAKQTKRRRNPIKVIQDLNRISTMFSFRKFHALPGCLDPSLMPQKDRAANRVRRS
jgi:hypothetical protein